MSVTKNLNESHFSNKLKKKNFYEGLVKSKVKLIRIFEAFLLTEYVEYCLNLVFIEHNNFSRAVNFYFQYIYKNFMSSKLTKLYFLYLFK
jgi:hypothetical protein